MDIEHHRRLKEDEKNKDPAERVDSYPDAETKADEATMSLIVIAKKCKDTEKLKEFTFLIQNYLVMKLGVGYLCENVHLLLNDNANPHLAGAQNIIQSINSAIRSCLIPLFDCFCSPKKEFRKAKENLQLLQEHRYQHQIVSNFEQDAIAPANEFIKALLQKFSEVKQFGAKEDEEIDSLEHVCLFYQDKVVSCSSSWFQGLHHVDRALIYVKFSLFLLGADQSAAE